MNFTTAKSISSPFDSSTDITVFNVTGIFALTGFLIILFINYSIYFNIHSIIPFVNSFI